MPEQNTNTEGDQTPEPIEWGTWLEAQPENIKAAYQQHTTGLQNAVKATRQERDELAREVKRLSSQAEKGSEAEKALTQLAEKMEAAERRAQFVEEAVKPEIGCRNPKAAYLLAVADGLFDKHNNPNWEAIKTAAPELFGKPPASSNAGSGTETPPNKADMNSFIRRAAGR